MLTHAEYAELARLLDEARVKRELDDEAKLRRIQALAQELGVKVELK